MIDAWSLANLAAFSAQAGVVITLAALVAALVPVDAAGVRYAYWRVVAAVCLALPFFQPYQEAAGRVVAVSSAAAAAVQDGVLATQSAPPVDLAAIAGILIAGGAAVRLAWLAAGLAQLRRLRGAGQIAEPGEHTELQRILGIRAEVRIVPPLEQPVTFGCIRPVVLVPASLLRHAPPIQRAVYAHELLHVQRRDWAWLVGEEVVRAAFWFHPLIWWVVTRIQRAREELVDEAAVLVTGGRRTYIEALLAYADDTPLVATAAFARRRHLFDRMMLLSKENVMSSKRIVYSCAVMALVLSVGSRYAIAAFPLHNVVTTAQSLSTTAGPLERRAHPVTPENPIPRRIASTPSIFPDHVGDARGAVTVRITLDESGRVAEARVTALSIRRAGYSVSMSAENTPAQNDAALARAATRAADGSPIETAAILQAGDAFVAAALAAVRQWRYDPPSSAPLSFATTLGFGGPANQPASLALEPGDVAPEGQSRMTADGAIRVGGNIKAPTKIRDVPPVYPAEAMAGAVQGVVILEVRIGTDGRVRNAHMLRSIPMLDQAALDAVHQWEFTPTLLNGTPIPVIMTVTVNFTLM